MRLRWTLLTACLVGGLVVPAGLAGDGDLRGARYDVVASAGEAKISGKGTVDLDAPLGGGGSLLTTRGTGGHKVALTLQVSTWRLSSNEPDTSLVLRVRVSASSSLTGCPVGARGTVRLVDAAGGGDTVQLTFRGGSCRPFARVWSRDAGDRVRVDITVIRRLGKNEPASSGTRDSDAMTIAHGPDIDLHRAAALMLLGCLPTPLSGSSSKVRQPRIRRSPVKGPLIMGTMHDPLGSKHRK